MVHDLIQDQLSRIPDLLSTAENGPVLFFSQNE
jgi:hypothetical protein